MHVLSPLLESGLRNRDRDGETGVTVEREVGMRMDTSKLAVAGTEMSRREDGGASVETPAGCLGR